MMTSEDSEDCKHTCFVYLPDVWLPLDKWLCSHPKYRTLFYQTIEQLFYGSGPMAICERHYIALMAASCHRCRFLMDLHGHEFKRTGGRTEWLKGLSYASEKIRNLSVLNAVLAHQPWSADVDHLITLTKCCSPTNWCLSELVQASVVLAQTHVLCTFVLANAANTSLCKIIEEPKSDGNGEVELLLECMDRLKKSKLNNNSLEQKDILEKEKDFLNIQNDCDKIKSATSETEKETLLLSENKPANYCMEKKSVQDCHDNFSFYTFDQCFDNVDFAQREGFARTHKIHEFSWEDQGYSCVNELYNEIADILDKKMTLIQNLTYSTMGDYSDVDTSKYRSAIWVYIQLLYGIHHDDYNYAEVNLMLDRKMKTFIKTACCHPHELTDSLWPSVMVGLKFSEKVHVLLIMIEARLQAELIYFFRALVKFNNSAITA